MLGSIVMLFGLFACALAATASSGPLLATVPQGCTWNGTFYQMGDSIRKSACEPCYCGHNGHINCAIVDCFFTFCVDSVNDPKHCCPQCPNGPNCMGPNNMIIKKGETYQPDPLTTCECPQNQFGFHATKAICAHSLATDAPLVVS